MHEQFKPQYDKYKAKYENLKKALNAIRAYCSTQEDCTECIIRHEVRNCDCKGNPPCEWDLDYFDSNIESYILEDIKKG